MDPPPTEIFALSLHDALPILATAGARRAPPRARRRPSAPPGFRAPAAGRRASPLPRPRSGAGRPLPVRSEEHTSELQSRPYLVCRLMLANKIFTSEVDQNSTR